MCPAKNCRVVLGPNPYEHRKLMYDHTLDGLVGV